MAKDTAFSDSDWAPALKDASLLYVSLMGFVLALILMGVPYLAAGIGLGTNPSWQTLTISFLLLLTSGFLLVEAATDVFTKHSKILQTSPGRRWKPLTSALVLAVVTAGLGYSKATMG